MAGVNKVILLGRLGSDPEVRTLPNGGKTASFSLATSESYNNKDGQKVEQTEWHRVELWESLANIAEQYLKKGDMLYVEGKIKTEKWTDKEGIEHTGVKIRGNSLQLIGGKSKSETSDPEQSYATNQVPVSSGSNTESNEKDDLPF
jgi:single-strand DNA-binding protein